ncbi:hypothetical protein GE115_12460 [Agromyces sp. CFH 90414]|uniref:Exonuclease domain-containing protein n=1 Tax=Agromyces agglutinans TaxID=2662258 RepID=A0A6I2F8V4_9MICO|nr:exonuclease domain-containing protein [Agromyces agglutinans]MRG60674.1 hypothetical protein [Agromyces agglutinans]
MGLLDRLFGRRTNTSPTSAEAPQSFQSKPRVQSSSPTFAIVDVETTGLSPRTDRIIELAVVHVDAHGRIVDEWTSRFNPEGPVGATHIHGITDADVANAPFFRDFAPTVASRLAGLPLAAHNAPFDLAFLQAEFGSAGWDVPALPSFCTLHASHHYMPNLDRRGLADCCWAAGIALEDAHSALGDARATAGLMSRYLAEGTGASVHPDLLLLPAQARTVAWPQGPSRPPTLRRRPAARPINSRPIRFTSSLPKQAPLIKQLTALSLLEVLDEGAPQGTTAYLETLLECLEDGELTASEAEQLTDLIATYGLSDADVAATHRAFILALAHRALDDGHVSKVERAELHALAELVGVPKAVVVETIKHADAARAARMSAGLQPLPDDWAHGEPLRVGDKVVFTGCDDAQRDRLEKRAEELGVRVVGGVSRMTAMLVTDGSFAGGKLAKATEVGTRVVHPDVFEVLLANLQPAVQGLQASEVPSVEFGRTDATAARFDVAVALPTASPAAVRAWAAQNGYVVGVRGRLPADVLVAFRNASLASTRPAATNAMMPDAHG